VANLIIIHDDIGFHVIDFPPSTSKSLWNKYPAKAGDQCENFHGDQVQNFLHSNYH
jgi:hypothetical protein